MLAADPHSADTHCDGLTPLDERHCLIVTLTYMEIGALIFPNIDQMDFTGPFEVLSRLRGARIHVFSKSLTPIRDTAGLILTPTVTLAEAPPLDVLLVPGGRGQLALMDDGEVLEFLAKPVSWIFSVCTGALTCGAAGLLKGKRATTHWNSFHLLPYFGAIPVDERVVIDGNLITTAGVSAGIDGALRLARFSPARPLLGAFNWTF